MGQQNAAGLSVRESDALSDRTELSGELTAAKGSAEVTAAIQAAIIVAKRFPRDEAAAHTRLMRACLRPSFAQGAVYSFPRGKERVEGPSVRLAREAARCWGNIQFGLEIVSDTDNSRHVRAWAWDVETNSRVIAEDTFSKRVYRKGKDENTPGRWVDISEDERELRELTNRRGAICVRNCILQVIPADVVEDAVKEANKTYANKAAEDPDGARKALALEFSEIGVTVEDLAQHLGKPMSQANPKELAALKMIHVSIRDGNSKWSEYVADKGTGEIKMPKATEAAPATAAPDPVKNLEPNPTSEATIGGRQREPGDDDEEGGQKGLPLNGHGKECTEAQIRLLFAVGRNAGMTPGNVKDMAVQDYGVNIDYITREDHKKMLKVLQSREKGSARG